MSRPAVSQHLRLLKNAGLVVDEPSGTRRVYALHGEGVEAVARYFEQLWGRGCGTVPVSCREHQAARGWR